MQPVASAASASASLAGSFSKTLIRERPRGPGWPGWPGLGMGHRPQGLGQLIVMH